MEQAGRLQAAEARLRRALIEAAGAAAELEQVHAELRAGFGMNEGRPEPVAIPLLAALAAEVRRSASAGELVAPSRPRPGTRVIAGNRRKRQAAS